MSDMRDVLRTQINQARAKHSSLQAERTALQSLAHHRAQRPADPDFRLSVTPPPGEEQAHPQRITRLGHHLAQLEERSILYRALCGVTCFEIDLDIGRRARAARREALADGVAEAPNDAFSLGLGVRIDTFAQGSFAQPFYLVFARQEQLDPGEDQPVVLRAALPARSVGVSKTREPSSVRLVRHTLPTFVPLTTLIKTHLHIHHYDSDAEKGPTGGFGLLPQLRFHPGFQPFLAHLNTYLQAYVSRQAQANTLAILDLPGRTDKKVPLPAPELPPEQHEPNAPPPPSPPPPQEEATEKGGPPSLTLSAYATAGFGSIAIRWLVPVPSERDVGVWRERRQRFPASVTETNTEERDSGLPWIAREDGTWEQDDRLYQQDGIPDPNSEATDTESQVQRHQTRTRPSRPERVLRTVDVRLQWINLEADQPGTEVEPTATEPTTGMFGAQAWTTTQNALLVIDDVRSAPRTLPATGDDTDTLTTTPTSSYVERRTRRTEWEHAFLRAAVQPAYLPDTPSGAVPPPQATWTLASGLAAVAAEVWEQECRAASGIP